MKRRHFLWNFIVAMCSLGLPWAKAWELSKAQAKGDLSWFAMWDKELKAPVLQIISPGDYLTQRIVLSVPFKTTKDPNFPWPKTMAEIAAKYGATKDNKGCCAVQARDTIDRARVCHWDGMSILPPWTPTWDPATLSHPPVITSTGTFDPPPTCPPPSQSFSEALDAALEASRNCSYKI